MGTDSEFMSYDKKDAAHTFRPKSNAVINSSWYVPGIGVLHDKMVELAILKGWGKSLSVATNDSFDYSYVRVKKDDLIWLWDWLNVCDKADTLDYKVIGEIREALGWCAYKLLIGEAVYYTGSH